MWRNNPVLTAKIYELHMAGVSSTDLAALYGGTVSRINSIVRAEQIRRDAMAKTPAAKAKAKKQDDLWQRIQKRRAKARA
jgi:hypothetical protein